MTSKALEIKPSSFVRIPTPISASVKKEFSSSYASRTDSQVYDQGITYNGAGLTYNEAGYAYGGIYGQQDKRPIVSYAKQVIPINHKIREVPYPVTPATEGDAFGPGFFLFTPQ